MLSNKLTFSLASLVLILVLGLVIAPMSVMAAAGGPTVTITEYSGVEDPTAAAAGQSMHMQTRNDFRVKLTFSHIVTDLNTDTTDVMVKTAMSSTSSLSAALATNVLITKVTMPAADEGKVWMVAIALETADADYEVGYVHVSVPADATTGNTGGNSLGNQAGSMGFNPPKGTGYTINATLVASTFTSADLATGKLKPGDGTAAGASFNVKFTASGSTGAIVVPTAQIQILDKDGMDVSANYDTLSGNVDGDNLDFTAGAATLTFTVPAATTSVSSPVTIGVNPNYAAGRMVTVPPAGPMTPDPTLDISLVRDSLDETAMTFKVRFTFDMATAFMASDITVKKQDATDMTKMMDASVFIDDQAPAFRGTADQTVYVATIDYGFASESLPLYVSTSKMTKSVTVNNAPDAMKMGLKVSGMAPDATAPILTATRGTPHATTGAITVTLAFNEALKGMPTVTHAASTGLTNTYAVSAVTAGTTANTYMVTVTPTAATTADIPAGTVTLTVAAMDAAGNSITTGNTVAVPLAKRMKTDTGTGTPGTGTPTGGTTNPAATGTRGAISFMLDDAALEAKDYIILQPATARNDINLSTSTNVSTTVVPDAAWTDLEEFFRFGGGSIDLIGPAGTVEKDVIISEIVWAADVTPIAGVARTQSQWIELYVAADATQVSKDSVPVVKAKPGPWMLKIASGRPGDKPTNIADRMSNWGAGQWHVTTGSYGQNGSRGTLAGAGIAATSPIPFVSMYRNINHKDLVKTDKNRADQLKAIPDGTRKGNWKEDEVNRGSYQLGNRYATPGQDQIIGIISADSPDTLARDGVVFNEIANRSKKDYEWIELHNRKTSSVNIKNWVLSMVTTELVDTDDADAHAKKDAEIVTFKTDDDDDIIIPGGGYLLVVNKEPANTPLAVGQNVADRNTSKEGVDTRFFVDADLDLPDTGKFFLILRTEAKAGSHEKIVDVAAGNGGYFGLTDDDPNYITDAWPLRSVEAGATDDLGKNDDKTWKLDTGKALFHGDSWKPEGGVTGVGVDRNATEFHSGTPGYANDAVQAEFFDADAKAKFKGAITISEIMVDQTRRNLPQWIELYNSSRTQAINIKGWDLKIMNVNSADLDGRTNSTIKIDGDLIVAPSQTVLIVSGTGRRPTNDIPDTSIYNLYAKHRKDLEMNSRGDSILSVEGFYISLSDARDAVADAVGNIDNNPRTQDAPAWALPMSEDFRSSILRRYTDGVAEDGMTAEGWMLASMTNLVPQTYYGDSDDMSSPGSRKGSPLPVSLSSFRPARDTATGAVAIRWITESEINNAGFNILRSETKTGEFKVVNLKGIIAGHGTTSEQHVYTFTDTTAKPNVVYYYQIEDVSLDGKRTTLATTHLRGNVNAAGKLTTTWSQLKDARY